MDRRPVTLVSGQFGDMSLEELCAFAQKAGYDGLELACQAHFDVSRALEDSTYVPYVKSTLSKYGLNCWALSAHLTGQCVGDIWDKRLDNFAPSSLAGKPEEIRAWAIQEMKKTVKAASKMGIDVITCFTGSPIWSYWYSFPQTTEEMVEEGYQLIYNLWTPIFDVFDEYGIKFALEVHPTEIAYDYYSTKRLFEKFAYRPTLGLNYDPSHLVWQGINELIFLRDFSDRVYHVHIKDVKVTRDEKAGVLGSHLMFGDTRRGWNFVSVGHGDVDFDGIIRELNQFGYSGPLSVEWEDSGMDRTTGATESCEFTRKINYSASSVAFDAALKNK
jgi:sugar phosphate isomerase/epimerase